MKCLCCRNTFDEFETEYVCSYCGFANFDTLDDSVDSGVDQLVKEYRRGNDYRKKLLSHVKAFSVKAYRSRWNDGRKAYDAPAAVELFDKSLSGNDLYKKTVISPVEVSQLGAGRQTSLEIGYTFAGTAKRADARITPPQGQKPWRVGMEIDKDLRLTVFVGDIPADQTKSDPIALDLTAEEKTAG